ncbi:MAG: multicopper oxidase family protein [Parafilimonas sp.]|nr:multicopper oxidase family protein [Parafilimonas sp.]
MKPNTTKIINYELIASEFDWKISEEKTIKAWGFNNSIPGPALKANKGDTLAIKVKNNLDEPTVVHWHGIRLPSSMDGTDDVQRTIQPGGEFEYRFVVPDAGTFWYHSHQNETVQMERGMYGALIVEEDSNIVTDAERVFMIDDMKLNASNEFKEGNFFQRWFERHDGRQGDTLLINGKENSVIEMSAGQTERWRFINASSAKYFRLHLSGKQFKIIATDGGLLERSIDASEVLLVPGERVEIVVGSFKEGDAFNVESLPYNRMSTIKPKHDVYATVRIGATQPTKAFIPEHFRDIESLAIQDATVTREVKFSVDPSLKHGIDFHVNGDVHTADKPVYVGELQVWEVSNTSLMDHPFHLHGFFFQVIEENGKMPAYKAWKDTVNIKPRSKVKIAWMPDNRPGMWMYHCHILEHHEAGMMAHFEIIDRAKGPMQHHHHHHLCENVPIKSPGL